MLRISTFSSFKYRNFRYLWGSMVFSSSGQWMEQVALSWLVWELTKDPLMLGLINGARAIPFLLSPLGGVAADRIDRKLLMIATQVIVMALSACMAVLLHLDVIQLWMVFAFTMLSGLTWAFNQPVRQAIVPNLVPRSEMTNAIALTSSAFNLTRLVGPIAAGFIIGAVGAEGAFAGKAIAYVGVIGMLLFLQVPPIQRRARRESIYRSLMGGFEYVKGNPTVLSLLLLALIPMLVSMPYMMAFMPVFADEVYGIGPAGMGMLYTFAGIGSLAGTFTVASLGRYRHKGLVLLISGVAMGIMLILFGWSEQLWLTLLILVGAGFPQMFTMSMTQTLLQMSVPDEYRGRVMSIYMLDRALAPLGAAFAGGLGRLYTAPGAVMIGGAITVFLSILALLFLPRVRNWRDEDAVAYAGPGVGARRRQAEPAVAGPAGGAEGPAQAARGASGDDGD